MQRKFKDPDKKNHIGGKSVRYEQVNVLPISFAPILSRAENRKTIIDPSKANGMHDETRIQQEGRKFINRSGGNMLSSVQEHQHSRIPELSVTLPFKVWQLQHNPN